MCQNPLLMGRTPEGAVSAAASRTAVLAAVAARAALRKDGERGSFCAEHKLRVGARDTSRALKRRRRQPADSGKADASDWLWDAFEVDTAKVGLDLVLVWFPRPAGPGARPTQDDLLDELRKTPGVLRLYDCFDDTVVAIAVASGPTAKRRLHEHVAGLAGDVYWSEVRGAELDQPRRGWLSVVRDVACQERRLQI